MQTIKTFDFDGRASLNQLYDKYLELESNHGWKKELVYSADNDGQEIPVYAFSTLHSGPALWLLSGVHGEEPAGPNAISQNIDYLADLGKKIPMVVMPLLNVLGYIKDWRYPDEFRDWMIAKSSVSDSGYYVPDISDPAHPKPKLTAPGSKIAGEVTKFVVDKFSLFPPVLTEDHHEDEYLPASYIYSHGAKGPDDPVAQKAAEILVGSGLDLLTSGDTRFFEHIKDGQVLGENGNPIRDYSVDQLFAEPNIFLHGQLVPKIPARSAIVVETPTLEIPIEKRIQAHSAIITHLEDLWQLANG